MKVESEHLSSCLFCNMAQGHVGTEAIFKNENILAFLDICPIRRGHVQIIPLQHFAYFEDLPGDLAAEIFATGQMVARAQKRIYDVERVAFLFSGGDIAHAHAHLVPMVDKTDITSRLYIKQTDLTFVSAPRASAEELKSAARELRSALKCG